MKIKFPIRILCALDPTSEQFNNEVITTGVERIAPWSRALLEELIFARLVKEYPEGSLPYSQEPATRP
jgi:hypothetical protein